MHKIAGYEMDEGDIALVGLNPNGEMVTAIIGKNDRAMALTYWRRNGFTPHGFVKRKGY